MELEVKGSKKISYAVVGSGKHALTAFIPALLSSHNSAFSQLTNSRTLLEHQGRGSQVQIDQVSRLGIVRHSIDEILLNPTIDVIYIATPNSSHGDLVIQSLKSGKHVLCEKPLSYLEKEINLIEELQLNSTKLLCTGLMYRLHPQYKVLRELLNGVRIIELNATFSYQSDLKAYNIRNDPSLGGGAFLDVGCYLIDVLRFLIEPTKVEYHLDRVRFEAGRDVEVLISGVAKKNSEEIKFNLFTSQQAERQQSIKIRTSEYDIYIDNPFLVPRNKRIHIELRKPVGGRGSGERIIFPPFAQVLAQINLFSDCVLKGQLFDDLTSGIQNSRDLCHLYRQIQSSSKIDSN